MRLIFDKEIEFLERELQIKIPSKTAFMDRMNVKVLDRDNKWHILYNIKAKDMKLELLKDYSDKLRSVIFKTWEDLIEDKEEHLISLESKSINIIQMYSDTYEDYSCITPVSGGKDSAIVYYLAEKALSKQNKKVKSIFSNTSNETHHTYKYVKNNYKNVKIINPKEGFYSIVKRTGTVPSRFNRYCCTTLKETPMIQQLDKQEKILFFMGMRKAESKNHSEYEVEWKNFRWTTDN